MHVATASYPEFEIQIRSLVEQHRHLKSEHLRLAVYFAPIGRSKRDVFLFEVTDGFGNDVVDATKTIFEFGYGNTPGFPLPAGSSLRLVLTNPDEFQVAVDQNWKAIAELRAARSADQAKLIYADARGKRLWASIK